MSMTANSIFGKKTDGNTNSKNLADNINKNNDPLEGVEIIYDAGYDINPRFGYVNILIGLVDINSIVSENVVNIDGYQRDIEDPRVKGIADNYSYCKEVAPVLIPQDDGLYCADGQHTINGRRLAILNGKVNNRKIICKILNGATKQDEAIIFGEQNENKKAISEKQAMKALFKGGRTDIISLNDLVRECGLSLGFDKYSYNPINALATLKDLREEYGDKILRKALTTISGAWKGGSVKKSTQANILRGMCVFYDYWEDDENVTVSVDKMIHNLKKYSPETVLDEFKNNKSKLNSNHGYIKTLSEIYDKNRRTGRLNYK